MVCAYVEVRGHFWCLSLLLCSLFSKTESLFEPGAHGLATVAEQQTPEIHSSPLLGFQTQNTTASFLCVLGTQTQVLLPTEPYLQSQQEVLRGSECPVSENQYFTVLESNQPDPDLLLNGLHQGAPGLY